MLVVTESDTETASAVPDVIAGVVVDKVRYCERNTVEEHIAREVLVRLRGHYHHTVILTNPVGHNDNVPVAVLEVDVVVAVAKRSFGAAYLFGDCPKLFNFRI